MSPRPHLPIAATSQFRLKASSVKKKLKDKRFAEAVNRDELTEGAEELGVPFEEHVTFVIAAMAANAEALGLAGVSASNPA